MKKILAAIMAVCIVGGALPAAYHSVPECTVTANAADYEEVESGVLTFKVYSDHAEVSKCKSDVEGKVAIPNKINGVFVTAIGDKAFSFCKGMTEVVIPGSVTSIGKDAFKGCNIWVSHYGTLYCIPDQTNIIVPDDITDVDIYLNPSVRTITCPESVTNIKIEPLELENRYPLSLTVMNPDCTINAYTYHYYNAVADYYGSSYIGAIKQKGHEYKLPYFPLDDPNFSLEGKYNDNITYKIDSNYNMTLSGKGTMYGYVNNTIIKDLRYAVNKLVIGEGITYIKGFDGYVAESVKIPDSVVVIGESAFEGCFNLSAVNIPDSVLSIEKYAFTDCSALDSLKLPDDLRSIGEGAFVGCTGLTSVTIPANVKSIGKNAFMGCDNLKSVTILNKDCDISCIFNEEHSEYNYYGQSYNVGMSYKGTIYGYEGSTAQIMAAKYGYNFVAIKAQSSDKPYISFSPTLLGDANVDDQVNIADAVLVMQVATNPDKYAQGKTKLSISALGELNGDVDGKRGLTNSDALLIQKYKLGLIDKF